MTLVLTCALCLAGAEPSSPLSVARSPSAFGLELQSPIPSAPPAVPFHPEAGGPASDWYQHNHGDSRPQGGSDDGHASMTTTMVVLMVAMMVVVGGVMMARASRAVAIAPDSPASHALPPGTSPHLSPSGG